jgi:hypothetical protein
MTVSSIVKWRCFRLTKTSRVVHLDAFFHPHYLEGFEYLGFRGTCLDSLDCELKRQYAGKVQNSGVSM